MWMRERFTSLVMFILIVLQGSKPTKDITPIVTRPTAEPSSRPTATPQTWCGAMVTGARSTASCWWFFCCCFFEIFAFHKRRLRDVRFDDIISTRQTSTKAEGTIFVHVDAGEIQLLTAHKRLRAAWHRSEMSVTDMFSYIQGFLSADQDVREVWMNSPPHSVATKHVSLRRRLAINVSN